jgi:hypothetical protein
MSRVLSSLLIRLLAVARAGSQELNPNIRFGMPAHARPDRILSREAFLTPGQNTYAKTGTPNWISWTPYSHKGRTM